MDASGVMAGWNDLHLFCAWGGARLPSSCTWHRQDLLAGTNQALGLLPALLHARRAGTRVRWEPM